MIMRKVSNSLLGCWAASFLLVAFGACSSDDPPPLVGISDACLINTDCNSPLVCAFRKCHVACETSRDCDLGQRCMASDRPFHVCQLADEKSCTYNSECPTGQVCGVDQQCRDQCADDRDCVREQLCFASTCVEREEIGDSGLPVLGDSGVDGASRGQPCNYTSQCPTPLVCRGQFCALECLAAADCTLGYDCANNRCVSGSGSVIGPEGGKVTAQGGKLELDVPPGALRAPISVVIVPLEAWPSGALGQVFDIEPSGIQFATPATITYTYEDAELAGANPAALRLGLAEGPNWTPLVSRVDLVGHLVSASIPHLSVYGLLAPLPGESGLADSGTAAEAGAPVADAASSTSDAAKSGGDASQDAQTAGQASLDGGIVP